MGVLENIVAMVKEYPDGIPLKKLSIFYSQTHHQNLTLSDLGFDSISSLVAHLDRDLVLKGEMVYHKKHCRPRLSADEASAKPPDRKSTKKVLENIVAMVKQHPTGIPGKKLAVTYSQTYHQNLTLSTLGFDSMVSLLDSLDRDLVVKDELVFHRDNCSENRTGPEDAVEDTKTIKMVLEKIVTMMEDHPDGVPLKKVAIAYSQKYHQNLALASLGFKTISCLVESLKGDLVVSGETVFHKIHRPPTQPKARKPAEAPKSSRPATPQRAEPLPTTPSVAMPQGDVSAPFGPFTPTGFNFLGPSLISAASSSSPQCAPVKPTSTVPAEKLSQSELYQRILQVMKKYQLSAPPMDILQACYCQTFGEQLPLKQYMSLYDSWEATCPKKTPTQVEPTAAPRTALVETPAAPQNLPKKPEKEKQEPVSTPSDFLSGSDFPALGAEASSLGKKQKSRSSSDVAQREMPVFKEAYYSQQREVHGANMRAVEAMEAEEDESAGRRRRRVLDQDTINDMMQDVIREIAAEGELVTKDKVISRVCCLMQIPSLEAARINPRFLPALKDLQYTMREINMFIESTEAVMSVCTLYELGQSLAGLKDKKHYEELHLGPLCKLPLVHRMFKIDSNTKDDDIHQIETFDILKQLRLFRKQNIKQRVDLAEFMKHLSDHYNCDSPYELGVRIHSLGLPIATLIKVSRCEHTVLEQARELIQKELEEEVQERLRKIKRSALEPVQGAGSFAAGNPDLRRSYASMSAAEVVLAVFTNTEGVFSPRMAKQVQNFLLQVSDNRLARALFQLAICGGSLAVPQDITPKDKTPKSTEQAGQEDQAATSIPSEAKVKQFLKDSLSSHNSAFTLAHMASLEKRLSKHFHVKDFLTLKLGNFLEFLLKNNKLLQDTLGSTLILGGGSMELAGSGFRPTRQDVFEFINQCGDITSTEPDELSHIEVALRSHYRVRDSRDLGYGSLHMLAGLVQRQRGLGGGALSPVHYQAALFAKSGKSSAEGGSETVGRLGDMSKAQALNSLLSCPLLEDLSDWSQWELIFKPTHGTLKDFIERNAANTGLAALEVTPGVLLRITTHTGDKCFSGAVTSLDPVGTAGHLVSMVVADGLANAPTALLANHMQSSLAAAVAKEDLSRAEEDVSCYSRVGHFLLACLTRVPIRMCQALLQQVFLEPFSRVLGQAKSKQVLATVAQSDPRHLNCLHRLGVLLGITDWVKDYHKKLSPPHTAPMEQAKSNLMDSQSSSLSALNTSEDEYLEESVLDQSFASSQLNQSLQQVNGVEDVEVEEEEEEDEEELFELTSVPNGETADGTTDSEGEKETSDPNDSCQSESINPQRALIEEIRKNEFGIGVELTAESQKLIEVHQERLGRSLDRLSTELYSKDTHFVLELIQNADDNSYPSAPGAVPALAFVVQRDCITVLNNETGFQDKNIRAICDVGRSTKGKHKYGYIGQKGIGFKSVFKVTDRPEIHSNGFHLRFDKTSGPMGYILPHWAEDQGPPDTPLKDLSQHSWTTKICLPLRSESHQTRNLFHDVHPSLLLFLHRLRSIAIYNQSEKRLVTMTRKDLSHNVLEVEHPEGTERWLVVKTTVHPKQIKEGVECTELALAFQLEGGGSSSLSDCEAVCRPQKQPVFAYLPLRSFGFRFIIQGDFDIPSSREDVDRDSSWNQWLRSEIPQLFLQAMDQFTDHPQFSGLKGLCHFLQFIPLPDEVMDFFKPVAGQIIQLLKGKAFLPTLGSDGRVVYKLPSQVAICQDAVIRDVIGGEELQRHLSLSYLHPALSLATPLSLLTHLGVRKLSGSDVTTVTTAMAKELTVDGIHSDVGLHQLAKLLVCNFRALEHGYGEAESILQGLRELPIIPLADGRVVALSGEGVFFPMEETKSDKKKSKAHTGPLSALYKDVSVVHPSLLSCVEPLESQQVRELLKKLGVHDLEPQELLEQHIYPAITSNKWKSKPEAVVVSYLVFIKMHSSSSQYTDTAVPVLTSRGLLCPASEKVHFSEEYGNMDLPKELPGCDWVLLSPCYVQTDGDVDGWRDLFGRLGVRDGLIVKKERQTLTAKDLASSVWAKESVGWSRHPAEDCVLLDDFPCEEFHALATAELPGPVLLRQRTALLRLLEANWDTGHRYSQYLTAQVIDGDGRPLRSTKSSFYFYLCSLQWVPAYRPKEGDHQERQFLCPNSVYLNSPEVSRLLGTHVSYVDMEPSEFSRALGMRESVSVEAVMDYLKEWCVRPEGDDQEDERSSKDQSDGASFTSTVQHIHSVYSYLHMNCPPSSLKELFQHSPAVFIEYNRRSNDWCSGRFYHLKEVCWSDPTGMFQRYKKLIHRPDCPVQEPKVLAPFYSSLQDMAGFFLRQLNVDHSPNMNQYVGLLEQICSSSPIPTAEVLQDVSVLYARLAQKCAVQVPGEMENANQPSLNPGYCSTLKGMVSDMRVFPTKDNSWVSLARRPMIADNKELEKVFKSHKQICLLQLPPAEKRTRSKAGNLVSGERATMAPNFSEADRSLFLEICGISRLSQCVKTEPQTENFRPCPSVQALVRSVVPYIQRFLFHHDDLSEVYSELIDNNIAEKVKVLRYGQVGKLYIRYQLDVADSQEMIVEMQDVICLLKDEKELYIQKDNLSQRLEICRELVKLFCSEIGPRKELMRFLSCLIASMDEPACLKRFLMKEDIRELPAEEELWDVPEPPTLEVHLDRALSRSHSSMGSPEEAARPHAPEDGERTLVCWPPRASVQNTGTSRTVHADSGAVEAVMKMWPPPAPPKDRDPEREAAFRGSTQSPASGSSSSISSYEGSQASRGSRAPDQRVFSHPGQPETTAAAAGATNNSPDTPDPGPQSASTEHSPADPRPAVSPPSAQPAETASEQPTANSLVVPEAVVLSGIFQGTVAEAERPPLNLDFPQWSAHSTLEDMELTCQRPSTVVLSDDQKDNAAIGDWGERLVNSFLCHWRDGADPRRPSHILWCNQSGESGQPYDFKLTFGPASSGPVCVYVEVKSTIKKEKSFIQLSANELDFALKEKERYHVFRVYSAGDAHNVRLCRIQNLAQHLHTKDLALYLFV